MTRLPNAELWVIKKMSEHEVAEAIERHIDYVDEDGRSVAPPPHVVKAFMNRDDGVLPVIVAIATAPIVLADGGVLAYEDDFDVDRGIDFVIHKEVMALVPRREECTPDAVREAMEFLTDEWLCDVAADYVGKCVIISAALTLIERSLLPDRPAFFFTSGRRGSGKGTALAMLVAAVTGVRPAMSAWSTSEEERRKAILSYFLAGVPYIAWDNIERGANIRCPHVERSCTSQYYSDRKLGVSEAVATAASTIHFFCGNNIAPRGDLTSRSLIVRLDAKIPDPENRKFKHPDPIEWTLDNRAEILRALYVILLGNPTLDLPRDAEMHTRFKMWWRLVGSAVEHAAKQVNAVATDKDKNEEVDFQKLFLKQEEDDVDDMTLGDVLGKMKQLWPTSTFKTSDVLSHVNAYDAFNTNETRRMFRDFFYPEMRGNTSNVSAQSLGQELGKYENNPVWRGDEMYELKSTKDPKGGGHASKIFRVEVTPRPADETASPAADGS